MVCVLVPSEEDIKHDVLVEGLKEFEGVVEHSEYTMEELIKEHKMVLSEHNELKKRISFLEDEM